MTECDCGVEITQEAPCCVRCAYLDRNVEVTAGGTVRKRTPVLESDIVGLMRTTDARWTLSDLAHETGRSDRQVLSCLRRLQSKGRVAAVPGVSPSGRTVALYGLSEGPGYWS